MYKTNIMKKHTNNSVCQKYCILKCVLLAISNQLYFLRISKVWNMLQYGSVGRFQNQNKECHYIFINILFGFFCVFCHCKTCVFIIFNSFYEVSNFRNRILTSQKQQLMIRNCQQSCRFLSSRKFFTQEFFFLIFLFKPPW